MLAWSEQDNMAFLLLQPAHSYMEIWSSLWVETIGRASDVLL